MQRYFSEKKVENTFLLNEDDLYHIKTVMRMQKGDKIEVVYQGEVYLCEYDIDKAFPIKKMENTSSFTHVQLFIPLLKESKMDLILQKATELGVSEITIYKAERSIVKIDKKKLQTKMDRWKRICKEASEQSKRVDIPIINGIYEISDMKYKGEMNLICSTVEKEKSLKSFLQIHKNYDRINIVIGPEGGLTLLEEETLKENGFTSITLGQRIMRVETVPIFLMSAINYEYME